MVCRMQGVRLLSRCQLHSVSPMMARAANLSVSACVHGGNVEVSTDDKGVATISMNKAPVNSLNMEFIQVSHLGRELQPMSLASISGTQQHTEEHRVLCQRSGANIINVECVLCWPGDYRDVPT